MYEKPRDTVGSPLWVGTTADEWLIGSALGSDRRRRAYVMHMLSPRFVARVVEIGLDYLPQEGDADLPAGATYQADDTTVLWAVDWIDDVPPDERIMWLSAAAGAALSPTAP